MAKGNLGANVPSGNLSLALVHPQPKQDNIFKCPRLVEVNVSLLEDVCLLLEVVPEPGNVLLLLLDSQVRVFGQTGYHQLHEVPHRSLTREALLQVFLQEHMLMERHTGFLLQA